MSVIIFLLFLFSSYIYFFLFFFLLQTPQIFLFLFFLFAFSSPFFHLILLLKCCHFESTSTFLSLPPYSLSLSHSVFHTLSIYICIYLSLRLSVCLVRANESILPFIYLFIQLFISFVDSQTILDADWSLWGIARMNGFTEFGKFYYRGAAGRSGVAVLQRSAIWKKKHDSGGQNANKGKLAKREAYLITGFDIKLSFSISSCRCCL